MGIVFQQVVAPDTKYSFNNTATDVIFDVHNDSPYNMGISFGADTSITNAQYFTSPHTILYGIKAPSQYTVGQARFNGGVYVYTQTPLGGTTDFSSSPAQSVTIIGYQQGYSPVATTALNRLQNVGNTVGTNTVSTQSTLVNDGSAASTTIIEATQALSTSSNVLIDNSGNATIAEYVSSTYQKLVQVIAGATVGIILGAANRAVKVLGALQVVGTSSLDNGSLTTDGSGNINKSGGKYGVASSGDVIDASGFDTYLKARGTSNIVHLQQNGADVAQFSANGELLTAGKWGVSSAGDVIDASTATALYLKARSAGSIILQSPNGTEIATFNGSTPDIKGNLSVSKIVLNVGGIKDFNTISGASGSSVTISHGLSGTPADAWATANTGTGSETVGVGNFTSTTVEYTTGASFGVRITCYR